MEENIGKYEVIKKSVPSLLLFIAGFVIVFLYLNEKGGYSLSDRLGRSFLVGWLGGGFIWGWSLTKKWFPNSKMSDGFFAVRTFDVIVAAFRAVIAFAVGGIAMPVGIIMTIVASVKAGKDAYKEAVSQTESVENSQENTNTQ